MLATALDRRKIDPVFLALIQRHNERISIGAIASLAVLTCPAFQARGDRNPGCGSSIGHSIRGLAELLSIEMLKP